MTKFSENLEQGAAGETAIARWIRARGAYVLPVYEKIINNGKGPRLYAPKGELVAPDMVVMSEKGVSWIEAKHKGGFSWYRIGQRWVTGIDLCHYFQYIEVAQQLPFSVFLLFLQSGQPTKDCPHQDSPPGLYGGEILDLMSKESHRSTQHGNSGMVYWGIDSLCKYADYDEVINAQNA